MLSPVRKTPPRVVLWAVVLLAPCLAHGAILRVPSEYNTIQQALNALANGDTISVRPGVYTEALQGPALTFRLRGEVEWDSSGMRWVIIDPTNLVRSDTLSCLNLAPDSRVVLDSLRFRNGAEMRRNHDELIAGGIANSAESLILNACYFDSCFWGIGFQGPVSINQCHFIGSVRSCVALFAGDRRLEATRCTFDGDGWSLVWCEDSSEIRNNLFRNNQSGYLFRGRGRFIVIDSCEFGPSGPHSFPALYLLSLSNNRVTHCLFHDLLMGQGAAAVDILCDSTAAGPVLFESNRFEENMTTMGQGGSQIYVRCVDPEDERVLADVHDNAFRNCASRFTQANAIYMWAASRLNWNHFESMNPPGTPDVFKADGNRIDVMAQANYFEREGYAVRCDSGLINARLSWWGDSSGPFHAQLNPLGQGGTVGDRVLFDPWLRDTVVSHSEHPRSHPDRLFIVTYPNPFNSAITIEFVTTKREQIQLQIFDLTGRLVSTLADEELEIGIHRRVWNADNSASGIYFARLSSAGSGQRAWLEKVVLLK